MRHLLVISLLILTAAVSGCANNQTKSAKSENAVQYSPPAGHASIFILRERKFSGSAFDYPVSVDGKPIASIGSGEYLVLDVQPGSHDVATLFNGKSEHKVSVAAGDVIYFQAKSKFFGENPLVGGVSLARLQSADISGMNLKHIATYDMAKLAEFDAVTPDGGFYKGGMVRDLPSGAGNITYPEGHKLKTYIGGMKSGKFHGFGTLVASNGARYEGHFENGVQEGLGVLETYDGYSYEGEFHNGHFEGAGVLKRGDRTIYQGAFLNDKFHGKGVFTHPDGSVWDAEFVKGSASGNGIISFKDGGRYEGELLNWQPDGRGHLMVADGRLAEGLFAKGKFQSGLIRSAEGDVIGHYDADLSTSGSGGASLVSSLKEIALFSLQVAGAIGQGMAASDRVDRNPRNVDLDGVSNQQAVADDVGSYHKERKSFDPATLNTGDGLYIINGGMGRDGAQCTKSGKIINCW